MTANNQTVRIARIVADVNSSELVSEILELYGRPSGIKEFGIAALLPTLEVRIKDLLKGCSELRVRVSIDRELASKVEQQMSALVAELSGLAGIEMAEDRGTSTEALCSEMFGIVRKMDQDALGILSTLVDRETAVLSLEVGFFEGIHRRAADMVANAAHQEDLVVESIRIAADRMASFCDVEPEKKNRVAVATLLRTVEGFGEKLDVLAHLLEKRKGKNELLPQQVLHAVKMTGEIREGLVGVLVDLVNALYVTEGKRRQVEEEMAVYRQVVGRIVTDGGPVMDRMNSSDAPEGEHS